MNRTQRRVLSATGELANGTDAHQGQRGSRAQLCKPSRPRPTVPQGQEQGQGGWRTLVPLSVTACLKVTATHTRPGGFSGSRTMKLGRGVVLPSDASILSHVFRKYFRKFLNQQTFKFLRRKTYNIKISSFVTHHSSERHSPPPKALHSEESVLSLHTSCRSHTAGSSPRGNTEDSGCRQTPTSLELHRSYVMNYVKEECSVQHKINPPNRESPSRKEPATQLEMTSADNTYKRNLQVIFN